MLFFHASGGEKYTCNTRRILIVRTPKLFARLQEFIRLLYEFLTLYINGEASESVRQGIHENGHAQARGNISRAGNLIISTLCIYLLNKNHDLEV